MASEAPDLEPPDDVASTTATTAKSRRSFAKLRRELTDDELSAPAVQRLLIDDLERLERDVLDANRYRDLYFDADKRACVLEEKVRHWRATDAAHVLCLTAGSALIGYAPSVWDKPPVGYLALAIGCILVIGSALTKVLTK